MNRRHQITLVTLAFAGFAGCAVGGDAVQVMTEATGSDYFSLSPPGTYKEVAGLRLVGRVCRVRRSTLLSPPSVRLEHLGANGDVLDTARASAPTIYNRYDQACSSYSTRVSWTLAEGETVRACFDHGRSCSRQGAAKSVVAAPAQ